MPRQPIISLEECPQRTGVSMNRLLSVVMLASIMVMSINVALAQPYVYWAGDKIQRANLDGSGRMPSFCNAAGTDVAIDPVRGKIFWAVNSNLTGTIMMANLNGCGLPTPLLTTTRIDQLQIDVGAN